MIWGCFSSRGIVVRHIIEEAMDRNLLQIILNV